MQQRIIPLQLARRILALPRGRNPIRLEVASIRSINYRSLSHRPFIQPAPLPRTRVPLHPQGNLIRAFHASTRREIGPAPLFAAAALLKSSAFLTVATTVARVLFTLIPFQVFARLKFVRKLHRHAANYPKDISPEVQTFYDTYCVGERPVGTRLKKCDERNMRLWLEECQIDSLARTGVPAEQGKDLLRVEGDMRGLRLEGFELPELNRDAAMQLESMNIPQRRDLYRLRRYEMQNNWISTRATWLSRMLAVLLICPILLVGLSALFSLERVPYTGRWRLIMLSPEEEDVITSKLAGPGFFAAVINLLTTPDAPAPPVVPMDDWRWSWVNDVMRRLEGAVIARCAEGTAENVFPTTSFVNGETRPIAFPPPPPPKHPLHPRPRAASSLHSALPGGHPESGMAHLAVGPPYSLLLLDKDEQNALSYGFGQNGAGGIVVFTGILDEILKNGNAETVMEEFTSAPLPPPPPPPPTLLQSLFGLGSQPRPAPPRPAHPQPTETQTLQLATVLAHELSHLLLSHHLEAVSSTQVFLPSLFSIFGDLVRAVIFPFTMVFGPFVNDAIANMSKAGVSESTLLGDYQFSRLHEKEADIVALRILAYAGYDPHDAVNTWSTISTQTCQSNDGVSTNATDGYRSAWSMFRGGVHADADNRQRAAKQELERWEREAIRLGVKPATSQERA